MNNLRPRNHFPPVVLQLSTVLFLWRNLLQNRTTKFELKRNRYDIKSVEKLRQNNQRKVRNSAGQQYECSELSGDGARRRRNNRTYNT